MSNTTIFESGSNSGDGASSFVISSSLAATLFRGESRPGTSPYRTASLSDCLALGAAEGQSNHRALDCCGGVTWPDRLCGRQFYPRLGWHVGFASLGHLSL